MNHILTGRSESTHGKKERFFHALKELLKNPTRKKYAIALKYAMDADYAVTHMEPDYCANTRKKGVQNTLRGLVTQKHFVWLELLFRVNQKWFNEMKPLSPFADKIVIFTPTDPTDFGVRGDIKQLSEFLASLGIGYMVAEGRAMAYVFKIKETNGDK